MILNQYEDIANLKLSTHLVPQAHLIMVGGGNQEMIAAEGNHVERVIPPIDLLVGIKLVNACLMTHHLLVKLGTAVLHGRACKAANEKSGSMV